MKFVLWITGLFALAVLIGLASTVNVGYAILFLPPYRFDISANLLLVAAVALIAVIYLVLRLIGLLAGLPERVRGFQQQRKLKQARHALREAGLAYFEGRYQRAEREAKKAIHDEYAPENRALALLIAARSADAMHGSDRCNQYLAEFAEFPERLQTARYLLEAERYLEAKDLVRAQAAIERVRNYSPYLTHALRLELKIKLLQKQPEAVLSLTERLLKSEAIEPERARHYRLAAYLQQLTTAVDSTEIQAWLRRITDAERYHPKLISAAVKQLMTIGDYDYAATLLTAAIDRNEDAFFSELSRDLSQLATRVTSEKRLELLKSAERWLARYPRDYQLLLALGRLAYAQQLWGKAQSYLEASLSVKPTLSAHAELVGLFKATGQETKAEHHYRQSVTLALEQGI